jgi:hypothetical protein
MTEHFLSQGAKDTLRFLVSEGMYKEARAIWRALLAKVDFSPAAVKARALAA